MVHILNINCSYWVNSGEILEIENRLNVIVCNSPVRDSVSSSIFLMEKLPRNNEGNYLHDSISLWLETTGHAFLECVYGKEPNI